MNEQSETALQNTQSPTTPVDQITQPVTAPSSLPEYMTSQKVTNKPITVAKKPFILFDPSFLLRVGLAFVFLYAAVNFFFNTDQALQFLPKFVSSIIPPGIFLRLFEIYELILAAWLLSGKWSHYAGLLSALTLIMITAFNVESFHVVFRNIAIIFAGLALTTLKKA